MSCSLPSAPSAGPSLLFALSVLFAPACSASNGASARSETPATLNLLGAPAKAATTARAPAPPAPAEPSPQPVTDKPAATNQTPLSTLRVLLPVRRGRAPCAIIMKAASVGEDNTAYTFFRVTHIATEESGECKAGILFDGDSGRETINGEPLAALEGGSIAKTGHTIDPTEGGPRAEIADMNFDGWDDLCIVAMTGAYNYSQRCWLFDAQARAFVRHEGVEDILWMQVDTPRKRLISRRREGGPTYSRGEWGWEKGQLVKLLEVTSILGETPDGKPLPDGYHWEIVSERRGGKLSKVREGPRAH